MAKTAAKAQDILVEMFDDDSDEAILQIRRMIDNMEPSEREVFLQSQKLGEWVTKHRVRIIEVLGGVK